MTEDDASSIMLDGCNVGSNFGYTGLSPDNVD
jgi:hypothetical protein